MTFRVILHHKALVEAFDAAKHIADEGSPEYARRWYDDLSQKLQSLEHNPHRCSYAREHDGSEPALRQLLFHSHRLIYTVIGDEVHVLRVRHPRQDELDEMERPRHEGGAEGDDQAALD